MTTFSVLSLGCKVNDYEATFVKEELSKEYSFVEPNEFADIYVIFSCCVTNTAEAKTRKYINKLKRQNPDSFMCVAGCYPQTKPDNRIFSDVDLVIGAKHKNEIPRLIKEKYKGKLIEEINDLSFESMYIKNYPNKSRAFLKIQDGCNQYCSYCVIPYARGNERSESHLKILEIAKELSKNYKEIVLTGIHTGRYKDGDYNLYNLLCDLSKIEGIETIRLSSIELNEISDDIINLMSSSDKLAHHLHIPVQSLDNSILKSMHRPYTIEQFKERIEYIRSKINDLSISTDLIVGYPGESDAIFKSYLKELDEIKFSFIHTFPYSKKDNTIAAKLDNQIDEQVKRNRVNTVLNHEKSITFNFYSNFINKNLSVLVEEVKDGYSFGYSKNYMYIKFKGDKTIGNIYKVKIIEIKDNIIIGEYVSE